MVSLLGETSFFLADEGQPLQQHPRHVQSAPSRRLSGLALRRWTMPSSMNHSSNAHNFAHDPLNSLILIIAKYWHGAQAI